MKLSEYITELSAILNSEGDLEVMAHNFASTVLGACRNASSARLAHMAVLSGREHTQRYWHESLDGEAKKGSKVVRL